MSTGLLHAHHYLPYLILPLLLATIIKALIGWLSGKPYDKLDNILSAATMGLVHLQLLLGLLLYFVGDTVPGLFEGLSMSEIMKDSGARFVVVEHPVSMLLAIILITIGRVAGKRAATDLKKHQRTAIFFAIGFAIIINAIPKYWWPF